MHCPCRRTNWTSTIRCCSGCGLRTSTLHWEPRSTSRSSLRTPSPVCTFLRASSIARAAPGRSATLFIKFKGALCVLLAFWCYTIASSAFYSGPTGRQTAHWPGFLAKPSTKSFRNRFGERHTTVAHRCIRLATPPPLQTPRTVGHMLSFVDKTARNALAVPEVCLHVQWAA